LAWTLKTKRGELLGLALGCLYCGGEEEMVLCWVGMVAEFAERERKNREILRWGFGVN